jgi:glycosyltransferase involved in cell wall biosynthesis
MKVLWLASWYPSKLFPYDGDFIQRHAAATALFNEIEVIHVVKDADGSITKDVQETVITNSGLTERIIYYKPMKTSVSIIDRFLSSLKFKKIYRAAVKKYMQENGKPAFVHVHIAMKAGLVALWLKRKYKVPYILSEQWGGYLDGAKPNINEYNSVYRYYWKQIFKEAMASTYVSKVLEEQGKKLFNVEHTHVIPNVVNTDIFYPGQKVNNEITRFIHISTMTWQKNPEAILAALHELKRTTPFEMCLYGPANDQVKELIKKFELGSCVFIRGEVPQTELAQAIRQSDALILYSRFETFGCVLIEANACGVPVIVSDIKVFHELVTEGVNGIFVEPENALSLAEKLKAFSQQKSNFNNTAIANAASEKYNFKKIGKQFTDLYNKVSA